MEDVDGNVFIDFASMAGAMALGNDSVLGEKLRESARDIITTLDYPTEARLSFLEALQRAISERLSWDVICHLTGPSGTDAVEAALKLARWSTKRDKVLFFEGSYHGMTAGAAAVSDIRSPAAPEISEEDKARRLRFPISVAVIPDCLREIEERIRICEQSGSPVAAAIVEVVQGEGGVRLLPHEYPSILQELLKRHEILLIVDEVQTGFGRCGTLFAMEQYGIHPDILVFSKAASGIGAPAAGIAFSRDLNGWPPGSCTGTFRGFNPAFASGAEFLRVLCTTELLHQVDRRGSAFAAELRRALSGSAIIGDIRSCGYLMGIEVVRDGQADSEGARSAVRAMFRCGLIAETGGIRGNVIRLLPPLNIPQECLAVAKRIIVEVLLEHQDAKGSEI